jgi:hypothetical protein
MGLASGAANRAVSYSFAVAVGLACKFRGGALSCPSSNSRKRFMAEPTSTRETAAPPSQIINLLRDTDVAYWCRVFGVSPEQLRCAVQHAGYRVTEVGRYLRGQGYIGTV